MKTYTRSSPVASYQTKLRAAAILELRRRQKLQLLESWYLDPVKLAYAAGFTNLDHWQEQVLRSKDLLVLLNCSRQSGKSTICALLVVWTMLCKPGSLILLVSPSERQSKELYRQVLVIYRKLERPVTYTTVSRLGLELSNDSRLAVLPGASASIRGFANVALVVADEFSLISPELFAAFSPMLAVSNGRLVAAFTPQGKQGVAWQLWSSEDSDILRIEVPATSCPRIPKAYLEKEMGRLGWYYFQQEFMNVFQEAVTAAFRSSDIQSLLSDNIEYDSELFAS